VCSAQNSTVCEGGCCKSPTSPSASPAMSCCWLLGLPPPPELPAACCALPPPVLLVCTRATMRPASHGGGPASSVSSSRRLHASSTQLAALAAPCSAVAAALASPACMMASPTPDMLAATPAAVQSWRHPSAPRHAADRQQSQARAHSTARHGAGGGCCAAACTLVDPREARTRLAVCGVRCPAAAAMHRRLAHPPLQLHGQAARRHACSRAALQPGTVPAMPCLAGCCSRQAGRWCWNQGRALPGGRSVQEAAHALRSAREQRGRLRLPTWASTTTAPTVSATSANR